MRVSKKGRFFQHQLPKKSRELTLEKPQKTNALPLQGVLDALADPPKALLLVGFPRMRSRWSFAKADPAPRDWASGLTRGLSGTVPKKKECAGTATPGCHLPNVVRGFSANTFFFFKNIQFCRPPSGNHRIKNHSTPPSFSTLNSPCHTEVDFYFILGNFDSILSYFDLL